MLICWMCLQKFEADDYRNIRFLVGTKLVRLVQSYSFFVSSVLLLEFSRSSAPIYFSLTVV